MDEDLRRGGAAAHSMDDANHDRYNVLSLFKGVWQVQPSAVLLPPPPGTAGTPLHHHRIVWGPRARA